MLFVWFIVKKKRTSSCSVEKRRLDSYDSLFKVTRNGLDIPALAFYSSYTNNVGKNFKYEFV